MTNVIKSFFNPLFSNLPNLQILQRQSLYYSFLKLNGLGYKAWCLKNKILVLDIGYSHYLTFNLSNLVISCIIRKNKIFLISKDQLLLNNFTNLIQSFKHPDPYSLKGVQVVKKKIFKKAKKKDRVR